MQFGPERGMTGVGEEKHRKKNNIASYYTEEEETWEGTQFQTGVKCEYWLEKNPGTHYNECTLHVVFFFTIKTSLRLSWPPISRLDCLLQLYKSPLHSLSKTRSHRFPH